MPLGPVPYVFKLIGAANGALQYPKDDASTLNTTWQVGLEYPCLEQ